MTDSKKLNSTLMSMQLPPLGIRHLVFLNETHGRYACR